jgi:hypothetical protein
MFAGRSRLPVCSSTPSGTGPFPTPLVPFEKERWSLLNFGLTDLFRFVIR